MTAKDIREHLKGQGRVYLREVLTSCPKLIFNARERKGVLQIKTKDGWHTVCMGEEVWSTEF